MVSPFHAAALSFARYQGAIEPQVVAMIREGPERAIISIRATSWSADRTFTPDSPRLLEDVRDIEIQLDDGGTVLWAKYSSGQ
jgi:hypothetical protein